MDLDAELKEGVLFSATTAKSIPGFIKSLKENAPEFNFGIRHIFDMREDYKNRGIEVDEGFQAYQVVACNFAGSYKSMQKNINRAAVLLEPKQIIVYTNKGKTSIDYLPFTREFIKQALPEDEKFAQGLEEACQKIIRLIRASL